MEPASGAVRGHVFQGRYKTVVVEWRSVRDGSYFKIVADYIHLNPVSVGLGGRGIVGWSLAELALEQLRSVCGRTQYQTWLETGRVLRAFQLSEDHPGAGKPMRGYLEARAKDRQGVITDAGSFPELRSGWYLGEKSFGEKVLEAIKMPSGVDRKKGSVGGGAARAHDEAADNGSSRSP